MTRKLSFYGLLATAILIGVLFYRVVEPFLFALLFALVLSVLFRPLHARLTRWFGGRQRVAAWTVTIGVLGVVMVPLTITLVIAGLEIQRLARDVVTLARDTEPAKLQQAVEAELEADTPSDSDASSEEPGEAPAANGADRQVRQPSVLARWMAEQYERLPGDERQQVVEGASTTLLQFGEELYGKTLAAVTSVVGFFIGVVVISMALYYLLADGDAILRETKALLPFDENEVQTLSEQFGRLCRGIVLGTVVAALAQSTLALLGFLAAGVPNPLVLFVVTMVCAFVPLVGAGTVVTLVSVWLAVDGRYLAGGLLLAYSLGIVSTCDNLIRAYVIGNEAQMNPLLVLITVIGAIQLIGLWGIFVGPMVAAFFYTIMRLLRERLKREENGQATRPVPT